MLCLFCLSFLYSSERNYWKKYTQSLTREKEMKVHYYTHIFYTFRYLYKFYVFNKKNIQQQTSTQV